MADIQRVALLYIVDDHRAGNMTTEDGFRDGLSRALAPGGATAETLQAALREEGIWPSWTTQSISKFDIHAYPPDQFDIIIVDVEPDPAHDEEEHTNTRPAWEIACFDLVESLRAAAESTPILVLALRPRAGFARRLKELGVPHLILKDDVGYYEQQFSTFIQRWVQEYRLGEELSKSEGSIQRLNRNLLLLNRVGQLLTSTLELDQITQRFVETVTKLIHTEGSTVWLFEGTEERRLICAAAYSSGQHIWSERLHLQPGEGIAGWVAEHGQNVVVSDAVEDERFSDRVDNALNFQTKSLLTVPLRAHSENIGVLQLVNKKHGTFDKHDCILAETLAASAAIAIENARLIQALRRQNAELEQQNADLDAYSDTVAHDLKNPITHFLSYADDLRENYADMSQEEILGHLDVILQQSKRMNSIIDELLLLARIRVREELEIEILDMPSILSTVLDRISAEMQSQDVSVAMLEEWPLVLGYTPWVEGVWYNYISNGLKYGGHPPCIVVGCESDGQGMANFWVKDNGPGLTVEEMEKLFEPFPKLERSRKKGHGLGLVIVKRIVERLGGRAWVESQPGKGSIFYFSLPCAT